MNGIIGGYAVVKDATGTGFATASGTINVTLDTAGASALTDGSYSLITAGAGSALNNGTWQFTGGGSRKIVSLGGVSYALTLSSSATAVTVETVFVPAGTVISIR